MTTTAADLDGDGQADPVHVYASVSGGRPKDWRLTALLDNLQLELSLDGTRHSYPMLIGAFDADADGKDELFVKVMDFLFHSAGSSVVRLVQLVDGELAMVRHQDGRPFDIRVGGITQLGEGADCRDVDGDGRLEVRLLRIITKDDSFRRWRATRGSTVGRRALWNCSRSERS